MTTLVWFSSPSLPPTKVRATLDDDYGEIFTCPSCHTGYSHGPEFLACGYCGASVARVLDIIEGGQALSVQKFQKQVEGIRR